MNNRCPKCNEKLSPLYMKQSCPKCNTNLVYYDLDNRLQADHEKAMKEQEAVDRVLNNMKSSAFGGGLQIVRFVLMFSPLLCMCLPMFRADNGDGITLINVIIGIIKGNLDFSAPSRLFPFITMVCIILFSLSEIIASLFSNGKKAIGKIRIFAIINRLVFVVCIILSCVNGASISSGCFAVVIVYMITALLHNAVDKKLNSEE